MNDDFLHQHRQAPPESFGKTLYQQLSNDEVIVPPRTVPQSHRSRWLRLVAAVLIVAVAGIVTLQSLESPGRDINSRRSRRACCSTTCRRSRWTTSTACRRSRKSAAGALAGSRGRRMARRWRSARRKASLCTAAVWKRRHAYCGRVPAAAILARSPSAPMGRRSPSSKPTRCASGTSPAALRPLCWKPTVRI